MDVVATVVTADCVHISVQSLTTLKAIFLQCHTLPFCKGVDYFRLCALLLHVKADCSFVAVEVVVYTGMTAHHYGCGHTLKAKVFDKIALESVLHKFNGFFGFPNGHVRLVVVGYKQIHIYTIYK